MKNYLAKILHDKAANITDWHINQAGNYEVILLENGFDGSIETICNFTESVWEIKKDFTDYNYLGEL